jgi:hypothetical protein
MAMRAAALVFFVMLTASAASAHETMFGLGPRTIWKAGLEVELEQEFEAGSHFWSGNNRDENPRNRRVFMHMITPGMTYGFSRDFALRVKTPFYYMREETKDGVEWYSGAAKFRVGGAYRFVQNVFGADPPKHRGLPTSRFPRPRAVKACPMNPSSTTIGLSLGA